MRKIPLGRFILNSFIVAGAITFGTHPPIIMADEPTGALDSKTGRHVLEILHNLHEEGSTIILITHDNGIACDEPETLARCARRRARRGRDTRPPARFRQAAPTAHLKYRFNRRKNIVPMKKSQ